MYLYQEHVYSDSDLATMDSEDYQDIIENGEEIFELPEGWESNTCGGYRKIVK